MKKVYYVPTLSIFLIFHTLSTLVSLNAGAIDTASYRSMCTGQVLSEVNLMPYFETVIWLRSHFSMESNSFIIPMNLSQYTLSWVILDLFPPVMRHSLKIFMLNFHVTLDLHLLIFRSLLRYGVYVHFRIQSIILIRFCDKFPWFCTQKMQMCLWSSTASLRNLSTIFGIRSLCGPHIYLTRGVSVVSGWPCVSILWPSDTLWTERRLLVI